MPNVTETEMGRWKHVYAPTEGVIGNVAASFLPARASPYMKGVYLKNGEINSDFGHVDFPTPGNTQTNELNGTVMKMAQLNTLAGISYMVCLTTTNAYLYNDTTDTWDCVTQGIEIDDCEAAWDAQANVTSTADTAIKLRNSKSAKHVIASDFGTGIVSSEDDLQNTDISAAANDHVALWIRSDTALVADVLRLRLSEQAAGGTGATYIGWDLPALVANEWQHVILAMASPDESNGGSYPGDLNALASVALVANSDPGAITVYLDDIRTIKKFTGDEDNQFSVTTMNDTMVITNGVDQPQKYIGSGTLADLTTTLAAGSITTSEIAFVIKDHLVLMNNTENAADCPQRASWTNIGKLEDFTGGTAGYQDLVDDESWVMKAMLLGENEAAIYKESSIVIMKWVGGHTPFRFYTMVRETGLVGKEALVNVRGRHVGMDSNTLFVYTGGRDIEPLGSVIKDPLYTALDGTYKNRSFLMYIEEDNELQVWIPTVTANPDDVWCQNVVDGNWYRKDRTMNGYGFFLEQSALTIGELVGTIGEQNWKIGDALVKTDTPITLVGDTNGKVYKLYKATLDNNGSAITNEFQTPDFSMPDTAEYINKFMRVPQLVFEAKGQSVTTHWSGDGGQTWNPTQGNGGNVISLTSVHRMYQQDFDTVSRKIRFRFRNTTASSGYALRYYGFYWIPRSGRR